MPARKDTTKLANEHELLYAIVTQLISANEKGGDKSVKVNNAALGEFLGCKEGTAAVRWYRFKKTHTEGSGEDKHWIKPANAVDGPDSDPAAKAPKLKKGTKHELSGNG